MVRGTAALLLAGALVAAAPAHAEERIARADIGAVALTGSALTYDETVARIAGADLVDYSTRIVRRGRVLATTFGELDTIYEGADGVTSWDASGSALLYANWFRRYDAADTPEFIDIRGGRPSGPLEKLADCEDLDVYGPASAAVAVDGRHGAYLNPCGKRRIVVRDLVAG